MRNEYAVDGWRHEAIAIYLPTKPKEEAYNNDTVAQLRRENDLLRTEMENNEKFTERLRHKLAEKILEYAE